MGTVLSLGRTEEAAVSLGRTISASFSSSTCHLGEIVCRDVLELSSSL